MNGIAKCGAFSVLGVCVLDCIVKHVAESKVLKGKTQAISFGPDSDPIDSSDLTMIMIITFSCHSGTSSG